MSNIFMNIKIKKILSRVKKFNCFRQGVEVFLVFFIYIVELQMYP